MLQKILTFLSQILPVIPRPGQRANILFYPTFHSREELLDAYYKSMFYFSEKLVNRITFSVTSQLYSEIQGGRRLSRPDYVAEYPLPPIPCKFRLLNKLSFLFHLFVSDFIFVWDSKHENSRLLDFFWRKIVDVDRNNTVNSGWVWATFEHSRLPAGIMDAQRMNAQTRLHEYAKSLPSSSMAYVFGTGPSLELAQGLNFSDGYRIVCNTIVKNRALFEHIAPHIVVAADAIYHFGNNKHADQFRKDLAQRLCEGSFCFLTADFFVPVLERHNPEIAKRTIPLRTDWSGITIDIQNMAYNDLPNILNGLLLPVASALADNIFLLGFDGRAPADTLFWTNSDANSYPDLKPSIMAAHPGFFKGIDYEQYAEEQSAGAETIMSFGEARGKRYFCLNTTFIPALRKRMASPETIDAMRA